MRLFIFVAFTATTFLFTPITPAHAADPVPGHRSNQPIDINADTTIEWHQNEKAYVARGNASARQGDLTVYGDILTAYYRDTPDGGTQIFRLTSEGHVHMTSPHSGGVW